MIRVGGSRIKGSELVVDGENAVPLLGGRQLTDLSLQVRDVTCASAEVVTLDAYVVFGADRGGVLMVAARGIFLATARHRALTLVVGTWRRPGVAGWKRWL
jgi:hypothetical protein